MSQTIKNLFISSDILWTLKIQEPYQPLDVDDAGDWFTEVKYGKCTLHSRMCASIIRNYLNRNIAGLCHFDQVQKLVDKYMVEVDHLTKAKEAELMEI